MLNNNNNNKIPVTQKKSKTNRKKKKTKHPTNTFTDDIDCSTDRTQKRGGISISETRPNLILFP